MAKLDHLHLIKNADRPVFVRQSKEAHGVRILEDAMANLDHLHLILKRAIP